MNMYQPVETKNYRGLARMFYENGLEVKPDGPEPQDLIACWQVTDDVGTQIAGIELEIRAGEYVIGGITVLEEYRKKGIGKALLEAAVGRVRKLNGRRVMLVAKVPRFFETYGFKAIDRKDSPEISKCFTCGQFQVSCFPAIMELALR